MKHAPPAARCLLRLSPVLMGLLCSAASAQSSPYYVGLSLSIAHDSNLSRVRNGQVLPAGASQADTVSTAALVAGIDQPIGRGRLFGSASLNTNNYANNESYNNQGYSLNLGLDWQTIERISGKLAVASSRSVRADVRDRLDQVIVKKNAENANQLDASVSVGMVTALSAEASLMTRDVRYSEVEADYREYKQTGATVGLRYRLGGATSVGLSIGQTNNDYPNLLTGQGDRSDRRSRNDVALSANWVPSGASSLSASLSQGKTKHDRFAERDFSATTGSVSWVWTPGGKLRLNTRLARDAGQDADRATTAFSRTTDSLRLRADYAATGKIGTYLTAYTYRRSQTGSGVFVSGISGTDTGTGVTLGARWAALRSVSVGCEVGTERLGANSNPLLNTAYSANTVSCFGQFVLQ